MTTPAGLGIGLPDRFQVTELGGVIDISWHWPRWMAIPFAAFAVAWDGFLIFFYQRLLESNAPLGTLLFPVLHVGAGVFITYFVLVVLLNRTVLQAGRGEITVRHGPLPVPGNRTLATHELAQLFCVERRGSKGKISYDVMARLRSGREVKLVSGLMEERQARYLEQEVERHLRIENQPVTGELPG